jgi:hypothetical protein
MPDDRNLRALEGQQVNVALRGGSRIDDSQLVSAGRHGARSLWLFVNGIDVFVPHAEVLDLWEVAGAAAA